MSEEIVQVEIVVPSKVLNAAIGRVLHAVAEDPARPILTCILFEGDRHGLRLVGADNYRLAIADVADDEFSGFGPINLPRDQVLILRAFLGKHGREVTLSHADNRLTATDGTDTVVLRLMDGTFPDYRAVVVDAPVVRSAVSVNPRFLADTLRALKTAIATRIELPDSETQTVYVKADGYSEYIMPIPTDASSFGASVRGAAEPRS